MMKKLSILLIFFNLFLLGWIVYSYPIKPSISQTEILQKSIQSIVNITTIDRIEEEIEEYEETLPELELLILQSNEHSQGSGVILDNPRCILTSYHIVSKASSITVHFSDGTQEQAHLIGYNKNTELAILSLSKTDVHGLKLNTAPTHLAQTTYILGFPYNLGPTVTQGIIASTQTPTSKSPFLMINALINPGDSGGAVINKQGELLGIAVGAYQDNDLNRNTGIALAVPSPLIQKQLKPLFTNHVERN